MIKLFFILSVLPAILAGDYNAKTLSDQEQDSILNGGNVPCARYRLEIENEQKIFRHSKVADWFVVDTMRHTRKALGEGLNLGQVRDAQLSPNGRYVAFAKANNLYIHKLDFGTEVAVTKDANSDIINGVADWLYEEEFGITAFYAWSPDSKQLAFVKLDERNVPAFAWQNYLGSQYPTADTLRYPKAGCTNANASVCVYDVATKAIQTMQVTCQGGYFPRLRWYNESTLFVLHMNRDQNKAEVWSCNAKSTVCYSWYHRESKNTYLDYSLFDQWQWLSDGRMIVLKEEDGWRQAFLYGNDGIQIRALTPEGIDVTALYTVDEATQTLYYQAAPTPATRHIYGVSIKKKELPVQLSAGDGIHSARFAKDGKRFMDCYQSFDTPNTYSVYTVKGVTCKAERMVENNAEVRDAWQANQLPEPELITIPNKNGLPLEAMLMLPNRPSTGSLPLVLMHYSGPASQRVLNRWRKKFEYALVEAGYAVLIVDPRGSDCRGTAWRNETYMNLGVKEAEDLIAAAQYIGQRDEIDSSRMAILGWSYGGYQTLFTMSQPNHPFKAGVAIAPVTDWRLYDSAYTERYMRRPQVNERGYTQAALLPRAKDLTGKMLIIHGTADDNVHAQHTYQYIDALVRADKQFEMQIYPDDNHHLRKGNNAAHMHQRILNFLQQNL